MSHLSHQCNTVFLFLFFFLCLQVKGYRYLEEDNSDESESEEEEDKEDEEHGEVDEEVGPGNGDEGGQDVEFQGADSPASWRGGAEVHRRRRDDGDRTEGDREERKGG